MAADDVPNVQIVLVDPTEDGFYKSRALQWASMCPHINSTEHRLLTILVSLCSDHNPFRKLTLTDLAALLPSGKTNADGTFKPSSVSTVAACINGLAAVNQVTGPAGEALRVSNKTKGDLRLAPWRILRHECTVSRNVHDALARIRGGEGEYAPRYPIGLGLAQNSVPSPEAAQNSVPETDLAQNSVPAAQDSVPRAQNSVPTTSKTPASTSKNRRSSKSPLSTTSSTPTHTPRPRATVEDEPNPEPETSVCVTPEQMEELKHVLRANLHDRATGSEQHQIGHGPKLAIRELAVQCLAAGASIEDIDVALSKAINAKTTHPYRWGTDALNALLAHLQGAEDPLGTPKPGTRPEANSWVDEDGFEWPHHEPYARKCKGQSCGDFNGKRYVAIEERLRENDHYGSVGAVVPVGDAFSCPVCRAAYKKEAAQAH